MLFRCQIFPTILVVCITFQILPIFKQEGQEALNRSPEYTDQKSNI